MLRIPLFSQDGFSIGIGDANRDGKLDFDFGLRSETYGNGPFGFGHSGAEIGFNTARGVYAGGDYSNHNMWGSSGGGGRIFGDGGHETGSWGRDIFGNHGSSYQNAGPFHFESSRNGGNFYTGDYHGSRTFSNPFEMGNSAWAGNTWSGGHFETGNYGNIFGGGGSYSSMRVPGFAGGWFGGSGGYSSGMFLA